MNYLYIDTEYSSFFSNNRNSSGELLEVGMVAVVDGVKVEDFDEYVRPLTEVWNTGAEKVHGITKQNALMHQHPKQLAEKIIEFMTKHDRIFTLVGHNCKGDQSYIERLMLDNQLTVQWHSRVRPKWVDTMVTARDRNLGINKHRLSDLCEYFKIDLSNAHNALADAEATRLVHEMLKTIPKNQSYNNQSMINCSHVEKRKKYMDKKYIQLSSDTIYISEHATRSPDVMKILIEELWELYVEGE